MIHLLEHHNIKKRQKDVGFLIPFLDMDRRYCLDPSLLRFTSTKYLQSWNQEITDFLKLIHYVIKQKDSNKLKRLLNIGEAQDAGLGYCDNGVSGSGMGKEISTNVIKILTQNTDFISRGFIRLEELQWFDKNMGPDRISDLVINILKKQIIKYTQKQCKKHGIPMEDTRVSKVFEPNTLEWISIKEKMPINSRRIVCDAMNQHPPILLLPKEIVRPLPLFLNYDDFYGFIDPEYKPGVSIRKSKNDVVEQAVSEPDLSEKYIKLKEAERDKLYRPDYDSGIQEKIAELEHIKPGDRTQANQYRDVVSDLLTFIFTDLKLFKKEKRTILGEGQKDIILVNNATSGIFSTLKIKHGATHIVVDTKNTDSVTAKDVAQVANYLNNDIGRVAFIVSRKRKSNYRKHSYVQLTKNNNVIFFVSDTDLKRWVTDITRLQQTSGEHLILNEPTKSISNIYSDLVSD